ncbi:MAG: YfhO family protein [Lachnospiraceae bacterium]|nr:YfhO family protein [Lachnospiraceae bacterium]
MREWIYKKIESDKTVLVLAFLIPFLIMAGVCIYHGIYPFGDQCFLHIDMYHQYCPFTAEFLHKLKTGSSLMYSWNLGLGSDFVALYAYYLASPMNWLVFLVSPAHIIEFMTVLIIIKIGLSGFTFAYYLKKHYQTDSYMVILFAVFYALSGFTCAYNWDIMWLDGVWLAPLIVLGLERLVYEKKCVLYYVTLALSIFSNYYISIMICIFLVIYYFILMLEKTGKKEFFQTSFRFGIYSLLAGGTSAVLLFPEIKILAISGSGGIDFPETVEWYFSFLSELARSCLNVTVCTTTGDWPNLYSGCAVLLLIFVYLMNRKINWKKKLVRLLFLGFFLLSFSNNILTFFWHGLDFPDGLPSRQTFLYIFLLLTVCFEAVHEKEGIRPISVGISLLLGMGLLVLFAVFTDTTLVSMNSIIITGILLGGYALVLVFSIGKDRMLQMISWIFAFVLVITEAFVNLNATSVQTTSRTSYTANLDAYQELTDQAKTESNGFYRIDKYNRLTKNEAALSGYPSASIFSSLMNISVADFYRGVGMEGGKNFYCYNGATPLLSAMLSVKYLMTESAYEESPLRKLVGTSGNMNLYENKYSLPLGFMLDDEVERTWDYSWGTSIDVQNMLAKKLGATEDLFTPVDADVKHGETNIYVAHDSYLVGYYTQKSAKTITADYGYKTRAFSKTDHVYLLDLGWCTAGTTIKITGDGTSLIQLQAYEMNLDSMDTAYQTLAAQTMELDEQTTTSIQGHIDVTKAGNLILSIPAEEGWTVFIDGKETETETEKFGDAFFSIPLTTGSHTITMQYHTPGLTAGGAVSLGCIAVFLLITFVKRKRRKRRIQDQVPEESEI